MVTSEMLFEEDKTFKTTGYSNYQRIWCVRTRLNRFSNPEGEWQVNAETLFVEILDENGSSPLREKGRIVITSLFNKAHPFIRYDIGDIDFR
jgi:phenylacetate-CoA ligase